MREKERRTSEAAERLRIAEAEAEKARAENERQRNENMERENAFLQMQLLMEQDRNAESSQQQAQHQTDMEVDNQAQQNERNRANERGHVINLLDCHEFTESEMVSRFRLRRRNETEFSIRPTRYPHEVITLENTMKLEKGISAVLNAKNLSVVLRHLSSESLGVLDL